MSEPDQNALEGIQGMPHIDGIVEPGDQRGRTLGFPTANIPLDEEADLDGVWAGLVENDPGDFTVAAVSVGRRRTFYGHTGPRLLEAHLLDVDQNLYGCRLRVHLLVWLRPQKNFRTLEDLVAQLREDVAATRAWATRSYPDYLAPAQGSESAGAGVPA
jgi:FAD synthase